MATTFELTKANVKKISCIADGVTYDLKKVVDTSGNVLWKKLKDMPPLSFVWYGTSRSDRYNEPDFGVNISGYPDGCSLSIAWTLYARYSTSEEYEVIASGKENYAVQVALEQYIDQYEYYMVTATVCDLNEIYDCGYAESSEAYLELLDNTLYLSGVDSISVGTSVPLSYFVYGTSDDSLYIDNCVITSYGGPISIGIDSALGVYTVTATGIGTAYLYVYSKAHYSYRQSNTVRLSITCSALGKITWSSSNRYMTGEYIYFTVSDLPSNNGYRVYVVYEIGGSEPTEDFCKRAGTLMTPTSGTTYKVDVTSTDRYGAYTAVLFIDQLDGTTTSVASTSQYVRMKVDLPTLNTGLTYNGDSQCAFTNYSGDVVSGTLSATDAGTYSVTIGLPSKTHQVWSDYTDADKTYTWSIAKASWSTTAGSDCMERLSNGNVAIRIWDDPNGSAGTDSGSFTVTWAIYDSSGTTLKGSGTASVTPTSNGNLVFDTGVSANNLGVVKYRVSIAGKTNYNALSNAWSGTMDFSYISIDVPSAKTRTYDGTAQYGCDSGTGYTRSGTGTNAGSHTTTVSLKDGYIWSDGTTSDKKISWTMKKASFTGVQLRLGTSSPYYVQWRVLGPDCASGKSFSVDWSISNTNSSASQPRASGSDSYTASSAGNLVESNTGTYTSKNPSTYKYYGTWKFAGSTNFNAFTFTCSKSNAKKIERGTYVTVAS